MRLWAVSVDAGASRCLWEGFAPDPIAAAELAFARWESLPSALVSVRETGSRRRAPIYVAALDRAAEV